MKLWQCDKYVKVGSYKFYYKKHFLKLCKILDLSYYHNWKSRKRRHHHLRRKLNGEIANPNWSRRTRIKLIERDGKKCKVCEKVKDLTIDHIIPLFVLKREANKLENLQLLCIECHLIKSQNDNQMDKHIIVPRD